MIKVNLIVVGSLKENYLKEASNEYSKRLTKFCDLNILELNEYKLNNNPNKSEIEIIKNNEGKLILSKLKGYVIVLDVFAKQLSSEELALKVKNLIDYGTGEITFVIGGSYGILEEVKNKANFCLSFSKMTFPHQLIRVVLLEQIYRVFCINNDINYHK